LAEACRVFGTPVTGGNVSLYNQSPAGPIDPTPTVGMVGLIADHRHVTTSHFKAAGDAILLLGDLGEELGGSHYLKVVHGQKAGRVPRLDFGRELAVQEGVRALIRSGLVKSAHDCSEGGLAVAVAESCISGPQLCGAVVDFGRTELRADQLLFNESQSRIVVTTAATNASAVLALCEWRALPARRIGTVGGGELKLSANGHEFVWPTATLHEQWHGSISRAMAVSGLVGTQVDSLPSKS
jgi:phosphoribosylformylglycinamidine synthase